MKRMQQLSLLLALALGIAIAVLAVLFVSVSTTLTTPTQNFFEVYILHHHIELVVLYPPICIAVHLPYHFPCHLYVEVFVEGEHVEQLVRRDGLVSVLVHHVESRTQLLLRMQLVAMQRHEYKFIKLDRSVAVEVDFLVKLHGVNLG